MDQNVEEEDESWREKNRNFALTKSPGLNQIGDKQVDVLFMGIRGVVESIKAIKRDSNVLRFSEGRHIFPSDCII